MAFNRAGNGSGNVHQGINVSFREKLAKNFQDFFSPAHTGEPIVHQSGFHEKLEALSINLLDLVRAFPPGEPHGAVQTLG